MGGSPHDALFKNIFTRLDAARSHLAAILPVEISSRIDWKSLRIEPGSFVDEKLKQTHSDILYGVRMGERESFVYVLFEHFSEFSRWVPLRLYRYVGSIWDRWLLANANAPYAPAIIVVMLHHSASGWRAAPNLASVFDPEDVKVFGPLLPSLHFVLEDISNAPFERLFERSTHELVRLAFLALASGRDWEKVRAVVPLFKRALQTVKGTPENRDAIVALWRYFLEVSPQEVDSAAVRAILLEAATPGFGEELVNAAEQLRREGEAKGRVEGEAKGRAEGLRDSLLRVIAIRKIVLSDVGEARIAQCTDLERLNLWVERAVTVSSETELFA